jgi:hypothetical protein
VRPGSELAAGFIGISLGSKQSIIVKGAIRNCGFEKEKEGKTSSMCQF